MEKFQPPKWGDWYNLLVKINNNLFIRTFHLDQINKVLPPNELIDWEKLKEDIKYKYESTKHHLYKTTSSQFYCNVGQPNEIVQTEAGYADFKIQIKKMIESAIRPMKEINTLQQHQIDLKLTQQDLKYELPVQPPKSTLPLPPMSQIIQQTISAPPKSKTSLAQLELQDQLIAACKQGDEKAVKALLQQGAKPDVANTKNEQPLGAAVWGMCPDVVNTLLKQAGGIAPMTWEECEQHNLKHYQGIFIMPEFGARTYPQWSHLLQKIDLNPFLQLYHLGNINGRLNKWDNSDNTMSWNKLKEDVRHSNSWRRNFFAMERDAIAATEEEYAGFRTQIKQHIESAKQPTVHLNF